MHVSDISSVHHQEFFTVHTAMVYLYTQQRYMSYIYRCCVYSEKLLMMERVTV